MIPWNNTRSKGKRFWTTFSIFFLSVALRADIGIRFPEPWSPITPLDSPTGLSSPKPLSLAPGSLEYPGSFMYRITIDSTGNVTASRRFNEWDITVPNRLSFTDYLSIRSRVESRRIWSDVLNERMNAVIQETSSAGLVIESPRIKSAFFKRLTGGETLSLRVNGDITIDGSMRNEKTSQTRSAFTRAPSTNFQMKQTQRFTVTGKIGENVSVNVDQDSERMFEFENNVKLQYKSDDDGIVQSIEAGNVALTLPGTQFVTFSAQNSGLFGIKSQFKLGGLDLTAITSMEKGQKNKKTAEGGKENSKLQIKDYEYKRNTYFFLDTLYRLDWRNGYKDRIHEYYSDRVVKSIEVFKSDNNYENKLGARRAWAVLDPTQTPLDTVVNNQGKNFKGFFVRLEPFVDYQYDPSLGYIALTNSLNESEVLAVAYKDSSNRQFGMFRDEVSDTSSYLVLKLLKTRNSRPSDPTWDLEWKNVYSLGSKNLSKENLDVRVCYYNGGEQPLQSILTGGKIRGFLDIFGFDENKVGGVKGQDDIIDINESIISLSRGELIFPELRPFDPDKPSTFWVPELDDKRIPAIYDTTDREYIGSRSRFYIEVNSASRSPNYSLGPNVIEGSETVTLNGTTLTRDKDYTIDYYSGNLTVLDERATNPSSKVDITYESQQFMSIDKKTLLGIRAEYALWEQNNVKSFIGASLLYMNQKMLEQRVRVGKGPMRNIVWDINTSLQFEPRFITKALDALPLLSLQAPSRISFEGEFAQVIPNPNTINNPATNDPSGVAYIDDFEGSKRETSLGIMRQGWGLSSIPVKTPVNWSTTDALEKRGRLIWYNPYYQVRIQDIWPDRQVTSSMGGSPLTHVLDLKFTPNPNLTDKTESWGGIMRGLSSGYADQTNSRFIEIWFYGNTGNLHIDLGSVSEDVIPNGKWNTEDRKRDGALRDNNLTDDEDTGLDGMFGADPPEPFYPENNEAHTIHNADGSITGVPYDFWDLDGNGNKSPNEPWSYDDWSYKSGVEDYEHTNGTEKNAKDGLAIYPDSEDLNGNSDVDLNNDYFEYSFSLRTDHPDVELKQGGKLDGWKMYRIPLDKPTKVVGNPDRSRIEYARIWLDGVEEPIFIRIAEINLVGNEWKIRGLVGGTSATVDTTMSIETINTHENPKTEDDPVGYTPPPGVEGLMDPIQKIQAKEQSLKIRISGLDPGYSVIAQKPLFDVEDFLEYKTLKMFVHGGGSKNPLNPQDSIEFYLVLASDNNNDNYYEVRLPVKPGWDASNTIELDFETLSRLKIEMEVSGLDSIAEVQKNGHTIKIRKKPSLRSISQFTVGVKNVGVSEFTGELWIDELRLSNVRKDRGTALRARADIQLSDFITLNGNMQKLDADFHTVNERLGTGSNTLSGTGNVSVQLQKFLPTEWGISIPVSYTFQKSESTPKYKPYSDILVNRNTMPIDSIYEKTRTTSKSEGLTVSLSKTTKSQNVFLRYLLDPVRTSLNLSKSNSKSPEILFAKTQGISSSLGYSLTFGEDRYLEPFKWMGFVGLLKPFSKAKFYYLPTKFDFQMDVSENKTGSETSAGINSNTHTATRSRSFSTGFKPLSILTLDYTKSFSDDMTDPLESDTSNVQNVQPKPFLSYLIDSGQPLSINQQITSRFNPTLFTWLTHSMNYTVSYQWTNNPQMRNQGGTSANMNRNISFNGSFDMQKLIKSFGGSSTTQPSVRRPVPAIPIKADVKKDSSDSKKSFPIFSIFSSMLQKIDPFTLSFSNGSSSNANGIITTPSSAYQFGFSMNPNVIFSPTVAESNQKSRRNDQRFSVGTGVRITNNLTVKLNYDFSTSDNQSTQTTGSITQNALLLGERGIPFFVWSVQWRGIEQLPLISKVIKSASLSHAFTGRKVSNWLNKSSDINQESWQKNFSPLAQIQLTLKNGMTASINYSVTQTLQDQRTGLRDISIQNTTNFAVNLKWSKRGGIMIPFLSKKKLENNLDFDFGFISGSSSTLQKRGDTESFGKMQEASNWTFSTKLNYSFTRNVQGGAYFELGQRKDLRTGKTTTTAFGINANIRLAGG
jgi:cell surface protein SprA